MGKNAIYSRSNPPRKEMMNRNQPSYLLLAIKIPYDITRFPIPPRKINGLIFGANNNATKAMDTAYTRARAEVLCHEPDRNMQTLMIMSSPNIVNSLS